MSNKLVFTIFFAIVPFFLQLKTDPLDDVNKLLALSLEDLMNIKVVTASGYKDTTAPSVKQVVTSKQITERGNNQPEDGLRNIPGIAIHIGAEKETKDLHFIFLAQLLVLQNMKIKKPHNKLDHKKYYEKNTGC